MAARRWRRPRARHLAALMVISGALGVAMLVAAYPSAPPAPTPAVPAPTEPVPAAVGEPGALARRPLARSQPVRVTVARVGIDATLVPVGANPDGTPEVPSIDTPDRAGWYRSGPSPGETGNAVILGHVDTRAGPAAFYALGALVRGDAIAVTRQDSSVVRFTVDRVESYPKAEFPTELVFGPAASPSLRLVTCGGEFDPDRGSYQDNTVVTATLTVV